MNLFYKRPLLLALSFFILLSAVAPTLNFILRSYLLTAAIIITLLLLILTITLKLSSNNYSKLAFNALLSAFFCALSLLSSHVFLDVTLKNAEGIDGRQEIVARIEECTFAADYTSTYVATLLELNGEMTNVKIELSSKGPSELSQGDVISAVAIFYTVSEDNYGFNERNNNISKGILLYAEFEEYTVLENFGNSPRYFFTNLRDVLLKRVDSGTAKSSSAIIKALLLGDKSSLENSTTLNYRRMGITHILSISGTHFTILLGMLAFILSSLGFNKKLSYFLLIPFALFYMGLTGFSESVCRSGIMAIIAYSGFLLGRNKDSYTALAFAVTLILLASPNAVFSVSLWLSFVSTFTIVLTMDIFGNLKQAFCKSKFLGKVFWGIFISLTISVLISLATLPIIAAVFGEISIISPLTNLLIVPLFSVVLYLAPFCVLLPNFSLITYIADKTCELIAKVSDYICQFDNLLVSVNYTFVILISAASLVLVLILAALPLKRKLLTILPLLVGFCAIAIGISVSKVQNFDKVKITYFTEGVNDGFTVLSENKSLCIDISSGASAPTYKAEYIAAENHNPEIAAFVFTHYHLRHINMFSRLCSRTNVQSVYLPIATDADSSVHMEAIVEVANSLNVPIVTFNYGDPFKFGECEITIFEPIHISRSTHPVINLQITAKDTDTLYLGSSFFETEFEFEELASNAEYVVLGQHSPVTKKEYTIESNATMICGSETIAKMTNLQNSSIILSESSEYEILAE